MIISHLKKSSINYQFLTKMNYLVLKSVNKSVNDINFFKKRNQ